VCLPQRTPGSPYLCHSGTVAQTGAGNSIREQNQSQMHAVFMCAESISKSVWNSVSPILLQELGALWVCTHCDDATAGRPRYCTNSRRTRAQEQCICKALLALFAEARADMAVEGGSAPRHATASAGDGHSSKQIVRGLSQHNSCSRVVAPRARVLGHFLAPPGRGAVSARRSS
jgi:hypothetical protein